MKRIVLTVLFAALLLLGIRDYAVYYRLQHGADPMAVLDTGLTALGLAHSAPDANGLIDASAATCPTPMIIGLFGIDGGENARVLALTPQGMRPLYIYLGSVRSQPDRWKNAMALLRVLGRGMAGTLGHHNIPTKMTVAILPEACPHLFDLNWTVLSPGP